MSNKKEKLKKIMQGSKPAVASVSGGTTDETTEAQETETDGEGEEEGDKSATQAKLELMYRDNPNQVLRMANFYYCRALVQDESLAHAAYIPEILAGGEKPGELTYEKFCDLKVAVFSEFWSERKKNKNWGKRPSVTVSPEKLQKKRDKLAKEMERIKAMEDEIKMSEEAIAKVESTKKGK